MIEEKRQLLHPICAALVKAYNLLQQKGEVSFPVHEEHIQKLDSIVKTVNANYFGKVRFPTEEDRAAAYLCFIIKDHPMTDGNKRLAVLWFEIYCEVFELSIKLPSHITLDELAVAIEQEKGLDIYEIVGLVRVGCFGY
jgi:prophage maintenance system killer protein